MRVLAPALAAILLVGAPLAAATPAPAHRATPDVTAAAAITGVVTTIDGKPLPSANIRLAGTTFTTLSASDGRFRLGPVPDGSYTLVVSYIGYEPLSQPVTVQGTTVTVRAALKAAATRLQSVDVLGTLSQGQAKALNEQRNALAVVNVVSQEAIQRFPDRNAAEAVQRVPGVSVIREEGEGETVQIRAVSPELNSVTINGVRAPAANANFGVAAGGSRATSLETIQADIVQNIRVNKALTPDLDGDAIGGQIDFELAVAPEKGKAHLELGYGQNRPPEVIRRFGQQIGNARGILGRRFADNRFGIMVAGSYLNNARGTVSERMDYRSSNGSATDTVISRARDEDRDIARERLGIVANLDLRTSELGRLTLAMTTNRFRDDGIRRRTEFRNDGRNDFFLRNHIEERELDMADLGFSQGFGNGGQFKASVSWGEGRESQPDRTIFNWRRTVNDLRTFTNAQFRGLAANQRFTSTPSYALLNVDQNTVDHSDQNRIAQAHLTLPLSAIGTNSTVKIGGKLWRRDKMLSPRWLRQSTASAIALADASFTQFDDVRFGSDTYRGLPLRRTAAGADSVIEDLPRGAFTGYDVDETISAGYAMSTIGLGSKVVLLGGVRVERTAQELLHPSNRLPQERDYTNVLPSAHLTWRLTDRTNVRVAGSTGLARPDFFFLTPSRFVNEEGDSTLGNPDLQPTTARSLDVLFEHFTGDLGLISLGFFNKWIERQVGVLRTQIPGAGAGVERVQAINGSNAQITGFEAAFNYRFTRLPSALSWLRPFGINANLTATDTRAFFGDGTNRRRLPFLGTPDRTANLALTYDDPGNGLSLTLSNNYKGVRLDEIGADARTDIYLRTEHVVDFSINKTIFRGWSIFGEVNNITDAPEQRTFGDPRNAGVRYRFRETYGRTALFGVRYDP
ncbi:MAG: TonB-dependent receptor [Gemmatimonadaceae bacterium]|nr:TonB-dependent receptor [Gemmatimonadaceae bacterium]